LGRLVGQALDLGGHHRELAILNRNVSPRLQSRGRAVQFLLGSFDEQLRLDELAWLVRDRFRGFFVGKEAAQ
jgi:hypothetical protein